MGFFEFLKHNAALTEENLTQPKLGEWLQRYLVAYTPEQQEKEILESMGRGRWYDMEQVLAELQTEANHER